MFYSAVCLHDIYGNQNKTNSDYFLIPHQLIGFYNSDAVCLLCSMT